MEANCSEVLPVLDQIYEVQVQHNKFIILLKMFDLNKIHSEVTQKILDFTLISCQRRYILHMHIILYLSLFPFSMNSSSYVISVSQVIKRLKNFNGSDDGLLTV